MGDLIKGKWTGWEVEGKKIYRGVDFCFWYFWGDRPFDIRMVRQVSGKKEVYAMDHNYYKNPCAMNEKIMLQLEKMTEGKDFAALLDKADSAPRVWPKKQPGPDVDVPF